MKYLNKYSLFIILSFILGATSCSNFDDMNIDPNKTTKVPASMLCTNTLLRITKYGGDTKAFIAQSALPKYVAYANESQMAEQYNKIGSASFDSYIAFPNIDKMVEYSKGEMYENGYAGVASFAKAYFLYNMTMRMGDIPNTQANQGENNFNPKYDTQESVFISILDKLKEADRAFANAGTTKFPGDPVYDGDTGKWRKATNSFALKVLISLSKKSDITSLNVKTRFSDIITANNLMTSNADNFNTILADDQGKLHPLFDGQKFTSNTMMSSLLVDMLKNLNDYRLFYYAEPSPVKIAAGKAENDMDAYVGVDVEISYDNINAIFNSKDFSGINKRYYLEQAPEPLSLISFAEQQLIIAEAIELGWISGYSKTYYESGVKAALAFIGATKSTYAHTKEINQSYIDNYFTGDATYKATKDERLKQIWTQRYILHFMQDATSSYFEYRRNKYPEFPVNPNTNLNENNKNGFPMRWLYPGVESSTNRANLEEALNTQYDGYDEVNKIMWLLK